MAAIPPTPKKIKLPTFSHFYKCRFCHLFSIRRRSPTHYRRDSQPNIKTPYEELGLLSLQHNHATVICIQNTVRTLHLRFNYRFISLLAPHQIAKRVTFPRLPTRLLPEARLRPPTPKSGRVVDILNLGHHSSHLLGHQAGVHLNLARRINCKFDLTACS